MPKYTVVLIHTIRTVGEVSVRARDEDAAGDKAVELATKGKVNFETDDDDYEVESVEEGE